MAQEKGTVWIWGSEELLAEGLRKLLDSAGFRASVLDTEELRSIPELEPPPELLLLLEYPERGSRLSHAVADLLKRHPEMRLVVLRPTFTVAEMSDAIELGVHALLLRNISREALSHAIHLVLLDETLLPVPLAIQLLRSRDTAEASSPPSAGEFSCREVDILRCLVHGLPNKAIARRLGLSEATVKIQIRQLLKKIGARNRTQAAIWALGRGIAEPATGYRAPGAAGNSVSELALCHAAED